MSTWIRDAGGSLYWNSSRVKKFPMMALNTCCDLCTVHCQCDNLCPYNPPHAETLSLTTEHNTDSNCTAIQVCQLSDQQRLVLKAKLGISSDHPGNIPWYCLHLHSSIVCWWKYCLCLSENIYRLYSRVVTIETFRSRREVFNVWLWTRNFGYHRKYYVTKI